MNIVEMSIVEWIVCGIIVFALVGYLVYVMVFPEKF
jgi:K+-transporting ATPase KdpF subunit